jgi:hypothetical protein
MDNDNTITLEQYVKFYKSKQFYSMPDRLNKYQEIQPNELPDPLDLSLYKGKPIAIKVSDIGKDTKIYYKSEVFSKKHRNNSCELQ